MAFYRVSLALRISLAATAIVLSSQSGWAASLKGESEYLGGTVHEVQAGARGTLELGDLQEIVFRSKGPAVTLPYSRIVGYHFSAYRKPSRKVKGVRLPSLSFLERDQTLDLTFKEQDGSSGTASFRISDRTQPDAEKLLSERIVNKKSLTHSAGTKLPKEWWGDKYWKTTRNIAVWPDTSAEGTPTLAAGTK